MHQSGRKPKRAEDKSFLHRPLFMRVRATKYSHNKYYINNVYLQSAAQKPMHLVITTFTQSLDFATFSMSPSREMITAHAAVMPSKKCFIIPRAECTPRFIVIQNKGNQDRTAQVKNSLCTNLTAAFLVFTACIPPQLFRLLQLLRR